MIYDYTNVTELNSTGINNLATTVAANQLTGQYYLGDIMEEIIELDATTLAVTKSKNPGFGILRGFSERPGTNYMVARAEGAPNSAIFFAITPDNFLTREYVSSGPITHVSIIKDGIALLSQGNPINQVLIYQFDPTLPVPNCLAEAGVWKYCTECYAPYFLNESLCVVTCPDGKWENVPTKECDPCHGTCLTCDGPNNTDCLTCANGTFRLNGECLGTCPAPYLENAVENRCTDCTPDCLTCAVNSDTDCATCQPTEFLNETSCGTTCPKGKFQNLVQKTCDVCNSECSACEGSASNCTECVDPFITWGISNCPACICTYTYIDFLLVKQDSCPNTEDLCFKLNFFQRKNRFLELRDIEHPFKKDEKINLLTTAPNKDYKVEVVLASEELLLLIKPVEEGTFIKSTLFTVDIEKSPYLGFRDGSLNILQGN